MATRNITVTASSTVVPGSNPNGFADDVTVINTGTAAAYLDTEQQGSTTTGQPLSAGSSIVWQKAQPLWVVAPSSTTLAVTTNSGNLFDAGAIASQILAQGLAAQIAAQIAISGAPPIDAPAQLYSDTRTVASGSFPPISPILDVHKYNSVLISLAETGATNSVIRTFPVGWWYDAAATISAGYDDLNNSCGKNNNGGTVQAAIPTRGPYMTLGITGGVITGATTTLTRTVFGSYKTTPRRTFHAGGFSPDTLAYLIPAVVAGGDYGGHDGLTALNGTLPGGAGTSQSAWPACWAGRAILNARIGAITTATELLILTAGDGARLETIALPINGATANFGPIEILLPDIEIEIRLTNQQATTIAYSINLMYERPIVS